MDLNEDRPSDKNTDMYFSHFKRLVNSNVKIHLFLQSRMVEKYTELIGNPSNVFVQVMEFEDLEIYRKLQGLNYKLPTTRCSIKDTDNFMILMNSKLEFVNIAIDNNVYNSEKFAWIDFGIGHVIKDDKTFQNLNNINIKSGLYMPGLYQVNNIDFNVPNWRFCGGFFIGDTKSIIELYTLYKNHFIELVKEYGLTWEVNVWAYFEKNYDWKPIWYLSRHNDSMLKIRNKFTD